MTCIAWDGKKLASDTMSCIGDMRGKQTKLRRIGDKIAGIAGSMSDGLEFLAWLEDGANPATFPQSLRHPDQPINALVIGPDGKAVRYDNTPYPCPVLTDHAAIGSGTPFALAAMHLGCTSEQAVSTAIALCVSCGRQIETLTLDGKTNTFAEFSFLEDSTKRRIRTSGGP